MANLIIKSSADNLVLQGSDASPAITVGATGTLTFAENVTMSGTANNLGTVTAGSIAGGSITSATTFPSGHVIKGDILYCNQDLTAIATTSTSFVDTGIGGSITTLKASSASRLSFHCYIGMSHVPDDDNAQTALCLRASSSSTTYALGDDLTSSTASYRHYRRGTADHEPHYKETHYKAGVNTPTSLTSYTAGQTLYWRYFMKVSANTYNWAHGDSHMTVEYKEIAL